MSNKVSSLVYRKVTGSAHRKAVLSCLADKASDDGTGVFCSKGTIAEETEIARSTVFKIIKDLVSEGVLIEAGTRACRNGHTIVYNLNLSAIAAYSDVNSKAITSPPAGPLNALTSPPAGPHQSASRTPTSPPAGPKPSLEPSLNQQQPREATPQGEIQTNRERLLSAMGADPVSGMIGPNGTRLGQSRDMATAAKWAEILPIDDQCRLISERVSAAKSKSPHFAPRSFEYFSGAMADLAATKAKPLPQGVASGSKSDRDSQLQRWTKLGRRTA